MGSPQVKSVTDGSGIAELYDIYSSRRESDTGYPHVLEITSDYDTNSNIPSGSYFGGTYTFTNYYVEDTFSLDILFNGTATTSDFIDYTGGSFTPSVDNATGITQYTAPTYFIARSGYLASTHNNTFTIRLLNSGGDVVHSNLVTLIDGSYSLSPQLSSYNEGQQVYFNLTYTLAPPSQSIYYSMTPSVYVGGTATSADVNGTIQSSFTSSSTGAGTITLVGPTLTNDFTTEGTETIECRINHYTQSYAQNYYLASATTNINDTSLTPSASVTASTTSLNEGSSVTFTVTMTGFPSGTIPYSIALSNDAETSDVSSTSGNITISSSTGTVAITATSDGYTETGQTETFYLQVLHPNGSGQVLASSPVVTINDTSTGTPEPSFTEFNLVTSSVPTGLTYVPTQSTLLSAFSATYGYQTAGNASGQTYELYTSTAYSGDHLFEVTVLFANSCSDPSIAIWATGTPQWNWGNHSSRIALQQNCQGPYLYGTTTSNALGGTTPVSTTPITLHLHHQPSLSRTRAWVTTLPDDWGNETTNLVGSIGTTVNYFTSGVYCGLSSDYDGASLASNSTNFTKWRITPG